MRSATCGCRCGVYYSYYYDYYYNCYYDHYYYYYYHLPLQVRRLLRLLLPRKLAVSQLRHTSTREPRHRPRGLSGLTLKAWRALAQSGTQLRQVGALMRRKHTPPGPTLNMPAWARPTVDETMKATLKTSSFRMEVS